MRRSIPILLSALLGALTMTASAHADLDTGQVVVRYRDRQAVVHYADAAAAHRALPALRRRAGVVSAGPRYVARPADFDDTGVAQAAGTPGGWQAVEWDLVGPFGIDVPGAWTQLAAMGARGGAGVKVAVVDTGVAYANRPPYRRSPDLPAKRMRPGYDFVANDAYPNDRSGHGTFVASAIAAAADNHFGMIGVAYRADIMPVRVLDSLDEGTSSAIARGIRYSVDHGAQVINLSVEFFDLLSGRPYTITSSPDVRDAIRYAGQHRVPVVVAAGNSGEADIPSKVARQLGHLRGGHDRARLPRRLLELRARRRPRGARAAAATPRCPTTRTARPTPSRGATSSRSASSTASTGTSRSRTIAAGASG